MKELKGTYKTLKEKLDKNPICFDGLKAFSESNLFLYYPDRENFPMSLLFGYDKDSSSFILGPGDDNTLNFLYPPDYKPGKWEYPVESIKQVDVGVVEVTLPNNQLYALHQRKETLPKDATLIELTYREYIACIKIF